MFLVAIYGVIWIYTSTHIDPITTVHFPGEKISFKVWAESDMDIQNGWVHFSVRDDDAQIVESELLTSTKWTGEGALTQFVSANRRTYVACWDVTPNRKLLIIFDREDGNAWGIEYPNDKELWRTKGHEWRKDWQSNYETLRKEYPVLPEFEWQRSEQEAL